MRVDHRGGHIGMAEQFLHGANVAAGLQQVGGETVAQRMRRGRLGDTGLLHGAFEGALEGLRIDVVAPDDATAWIGGEAILRKQPELGPAAARAWIFAVQRMG